MKKSNYFKIITTVVVFFSFFNLFAQNNCEPVIVIDSTITSCKGESVNVIPIISNLDRNQPITFQWEILHDNKWQPISNETSESLTISRLDSGSNIRLSLSTQLSCSTTNKFYSNILKLSLLSLFAPYTEIEADYSDYCKNGSVAFKTIKCDFCMLKNRFEWFVNGVYIAKSDINGVVVFGKGTLKNNDVVYVHMYIPNSVVCAVIKSYTSAPIVVEVPVCQPTHTNDQTIEATKTVLGIYNIQGMEVDKNYKGLVLYKYSDGSISKMLRE
jgi:hypothetical protein